MTLRKGLDETVLSLCAPAGPVRARAALREARARADEPETILRTAAGSLGVDLIPTTYSAGDRREPIVVFGDDILLIDKQRGVNFDDVAELAGRRGSSELPAAVPVLRRPLQSLAGRTDWGRVFAFLQMERSDLWVVLTYSAAIGLMTLATPIAVQTLFDIVAFGTLLQPLIVVALILLGVLLFSGLLRVLEVIAVEFISRRIFVRVATDFAHRIPLVDRAKIPTEQLRERVNRFFDAVVVQKSASKIILDGTTAALQIIVGLLLLAFYHPLLLAFDVALIGGVLIVFLLGRTAVSTAVLESKYKFRIAAWLGEVASAPNTFGSVTGYRYAENRTNDLLAHWLDARKKQFRVTLRQFGGMLFLQVLAGVGLLIIGGALVISRQLTLGQLVAAELVMSVTVASLAKIGKMFPKVYDLVAALGKLAQVVELPLREPEGEIFGDGAAVALSIDGSISVAPGERVAALGAPAGLFDLVNRITINGVSAEDIEPTDLRERVMVLSRRGLFEGDVLENLIVADDRITHQTARTALERVGANELAVEMDRQVGPQGSALSPCERVQLLAARALLAKPRALVLDRVLDPVDEDTVTQVIDALEDLEGTTVVCLTVRRSTASQLPRIVELGVLEAA